MPGGLYATFNLKGEESELGWFIKWVYQEWLPNSGFETTTEPSYAIMNKNHFIDESGVDATFYLPIQNI